MSEANFVTLDAAWPPGFPFGYRHSCGGIAFWLHDRPQPSAPFSSEGIMIRADGEWVPALPGMACLCAHCGEPLSMFPSVSRVVDLREPI